MKPRLYALILFILSILSAPLHAQNSACSEIILQTSKSSYARGEFASAKRDLESCVNEQGFGNLKELNQARELLSLKAIEQGRLEDAKFFTEQIVNSNSNYNSTYRNIVFDSIFDKVKQENTVPTVISVSKKMEDLKTAPATVKLVTQEEIMDRGYKDLIDVLSDLPGFDISKTFSGAGANIYQMGFRQENTERTLFMVDGVEENDLFSNWAYISRQYPLANIKAVEIVYGPSSTMYGPRAFVGTINVITYSPREIPEDHLLKGKPKSGKPKSFYAYGNTQAGNLNTFSSDLVMGLRGNRAAFQATGRIYRSDEHNMSSAEFFDYAPDDINSLRYTNMNMSGRAGSYTFEQYLSQFTLPQTHPYYTVTKNSQGLITNMNITTAGINAARRLDSMAYASPVNGAPIGFSNHTDDYFFSAKLMVDNFLFGVRHWKRTEGFGLYQDIDAAGSRNGSIWSPENTTIYAQYDRQLSEKISISNLSNFAIHRLGKETNRVNFVAFGDPRANLHFAHLLNPAEILPAKTFTTKKNASGTEIIDNSSLSFFKHGWSNRYYHYEAQQFRNETRLFYEGERLKFSSGIDFRSTLTQGDYLIYQDYNTNYPDTKAFQAKQDTISFARELGIVPNMKKDSNLFSMIDLGLFIQANYSFGEKIFLTGGYRVDYNPLITNKGNVGFVNSPRLSAIYNSQNTTFKFNYSKGHQNVSQLTRYSTDGGRTPNPNLRPESIDFLSLEYLGHFMDGSLGWDINAFGYLIENAVATSTRNGIRQNINIGKYRTLGLMSGFYYKPKSRDWNIQANHTYFYPQLTAADAGIEVPVRLGDIASHRFNLSVTKQTHMGILSNVLNLRANYVSERPIGINTTQSKNIGIDGKGSPIPEYLILHGNIGFKVQTLPMLRLDLSVENILNKNLLDGGNPEYYHPGPREASGTFNMPGAVAGATYGDLSQPYIPQRARFFLLRLTYSL